MRSGFWPDIFQYSPQCKYSYQGKQKNFSQDDNHAPLHIYAVYTAFADDAELPGIRRKMSGS
jgi:hypothetical protein